MSDGHKVLSREGVIEEINLLRTVATTGVVDNYGRIAIDVARLRVAIRQVGKFRQDNNDDFGLAIAALNETADNLSTHVVNFTDAAYFDKYRFGCVIRDVGEIFKYDDCELQAKMEYVGQVHLQEFHEANAKLNKAYADVSALEYKLRRLSQHTISDPSVRAEVFAKTDGHCFYCEVKLIKCNAELSDTCDKSHVFHVDHIVAKENGGPDHISNYVPSCAGCNLAKSDKQFLDFVRKPRLRLLAGGAG